MKLYIYEDYSGIITYEGNDKTKLKSGYIINNTISGISSEGIVDFSICRSSIERRHSNIVSMKLVELKDENYLSIYLKGGEGGSNWDEQLIVKVDAKDNFEIIANASVGYCHDCGDWAKISLKIIQDGFELTEIRDSMKLVNDKWEREWRKKKKLKTVKL